VRDPNARTQYQLRLPKKLRKRKWKIGAIKNFINAHLFGYGQMISEEVTSSRAAEKYSSKPPSSKEQHRKDKNDDDDDDDDDDKDAVKKDDDDDDGKHKAKSWRKTGKSTEKMKNGGKTNEQHLYRSSLADRAEERMPERLLEYSSYEPSLLLKIVWGLEQFSLSASDLNVVVFFFLLPWFRQLWR